jgi:hypothetical protein
MHALRSAESRIELLAAAHRVFIRQIPPAEAVCQFPEDAFQKEAIGGQWLAAVIFPGEIELGMQGDKSFLQYQPLSIGEMRRFPAQIRVQII